MQGVPDGRDAKWLGGPVCAKAVQFLERLGGTVRRRAEVSYLWMPIPAVYGRYATRDPLSQPTILRRLTDYVAMLGLRDSSGRAFQIHPHMFRRTLARYVVRYDTTNLLALKEHFKHISITMTDHYVGDDALGQDFQERECYRQPLKMVIRSPPKLDGIPVKAEHDSVLSVL